MLTVVQWRFKVDALVDAIQLKKNCCLIFKGPLSQSVAVPGVACRPDSVAVFYVTLWRHRLTRERRSCASGIFYSHFFTTACRKCFYSHADGSRQPRASRWLNNILSFCAPFYIFSRPCDSPPLPPPADDACLLPRAHFLCAMAAIGHYSTSSHRSSV